jgi:hypothetical protein
MVLDMFLNIIVQLKYQKYWEFLQNVSPTLNFFFLNTKILHVNGSMKWQIVHRV